MAEPKQSRGVIRVEQTRRRKRTRAVEPPGSASRECTASARSEEHRWPHTVAGSKCDDSIRESKSWRRQQQWLRAALLEMQGQRAHDARQLDDLRREIASLRSAEQNA